MKPRAPVPHLLCFDPKEIEGLTARLWMREELPVPGSRFPLHRGRLDGEELAVLRVPFGDRVELLETVVRGLLEVSRPSQAIALGTAMTGHDSLAVGDLLLSTGAWRDGRRLDFGAWLRDEALAALPHDLRLREGTTATAPAFVATAADRDALLKAAPGALGIEMEDHHLARLMAEAGVPFAALRTVTDRGDFAEHMAHRADAAARALRMWRRIQRRRRMVRSLAPIDNPPTRDLAYRILVRTPGRSLTLPDAVGLARLAVRGLGLDQVLAPGGRLEILVADPATSDRWLAVPGGEGRVVRAAPVHALALDPPATFARVVLAPSPALELLGRPGPLPRLEPGLAARIAAAPLEPLLEPEPGPTAPPLPRDVPFHIQGLNSISAEPEEGLLAATTVDEFKDNAHRVADSVESPIWIYRSANSRDASYFEPEYEVPSRVGREVPEGTYLIATGLGPAIDPAARGGAMASTLVLGDEQGGRLIQYLDELSAAPFTADDVFRYEGMVQRLDPESVALARLDRRPVLTPTGVNGLRFEPETLRQIYSRDYDRYLEKYFSSRRRTRPARASHLLMTSRGCGYHCSFCCSGGMQPFAALGEEQLVGLLKKIREREGLGPGEHIDVYMTDSYFNKDPGRVVALADRLEAEGLLESFEIFVRHNGLQAFLTRRARDGAPPVVHEALVAAYKKLGIDEIVIGVDAYTSQSIRMLKTNFDAVAFKGEDTRPVYSFADIEAALGAIEAAGMASRCFLLVYNPFVDDADRLETFYNLVRLAVRLPRFRIDSDSSDRVNELQPFPGAPLTRFAEAIPGLVQGDRFEYATPLGKLEDLMDLKMFGFTREGEPARGEFASRLSRARDRLARALADHAIQRGAEPILAPVLAAAETFVRGETMLAELFEGRPLDGLDRPAEARVRLITEGLAALPPSDLAPTETAPDRFYATLARPEIRQHLGQREPRR